MIVKLLWLCCEAGSIQVWCLYQVRVSFIEPSVSNAAYLLSVLTSLSLHVLAVYNHHHVHIYLAKIIPLCVNITCLVWTRRWILIQICLELILKLKFLKCYSLLQSLAVHWSIFIWYLYLQCWILWNCIPLLQHGYFVCYFHSLCRCISSVITCMLYMFEWLEDFSTLLGWLCYCFVCVFRDFIECAIIVL
jgi:hypothetical protein